MIAEFWAPTRGRDKPVLQHRDGNGERWLSIQLHTPVLYEDLAGAAMGCEPERVRGFVAGVELMLIAPEPRLIVQLQTKPPDELQLIEKLEHDSNECWGEFAKDKGRTKSCKRCGFKHEGNGEPPRPHKRWRTP